VSTEAPMIYREQELDLVVTRREMVAAGVVALTLADLAGTALPGWTPGAHIDVVLNDTLTRQYSLCGPLRDRSSFTIAILRDPSGSGSQLAHDSLTEGGQVRIRGPRNHFALIDAPRYMFIAGGIGITPLLPMIESADRRGVPWTLDYGGRQRSSMAFTGQLGRYGDRVRMWPQDEAGLIDLDVILGDPRPDVLVYCCGPEPLLSAVEARCAAWPPGALHTERFTPRPVVPGAGRDEPFELVLQRSGITAVVPAERTILEVVEENGLSVLSSCRVGTCGTCEQEVVSGEIDHRDSVLSEEDQEAGEYMMICVSRCRSERLVLDL
jgi:ferredoxin-NADP reductase